MPKENEPWSITIDRFDGFTPAYTENTYPFYGNKEHASAMRNADIRDPNVLTQGPAPTNLTSGDENGSVSTLISAIMGSVTASNAGLAVGGDKVYEITQTAVTSSTYPLTIDKGAVTGEAADDVLHYQSNAYVFYNHSGSAG